VRRILLSLVASLLACDQSEEWCPEGRPAHAGLYRSKGGGWSNGSGVWAHADVGPKTMALERDLGDIPVVRLTYQRAGKTVVETWRGESGPHAFRFTNSEIPPLSLKIAHVPPSEGGFEADFESFVGQSQTRRFRLSSIGTLTTPVTITVEGAAFSLERNDCDTFASSRMCTFDIGFRPTTATHVKGKMIMKTLSPVFDLTEPLYGLGFAPDAGTD
jgi:hypothetical protein